MRTNVLSIKLDSLSQSEEDCNFFSMYLLPTIYFWQSKNMQSCELWKSLKILWLIRLLQHELSRSDLDDLIYESIKSESNLSKMLMIWFMKVLNLSQIELRFKQDVDDLICESIKSESDLSQIWARCWWFNLWEY